MKTKSETIDLFKAFSLLDTPEEAKKFLADICTPQEIKALSERWEVCQLLAPGNLSYREIKEITGTSTTTITRVARFLNNEPNCGYKTILAKI
ncbi:MAG: trp operon repressor [Holosporales bacterium]|jgi:TrpR-related protein YerC/YecD|nr:trp operon repressor [Holosporales bacterium]